MQTRAQHRATAAELNVSDDEEELLSDTPTATEEQFVDLAPSNTGSIGEDPERTQEINVDEAFYDAVDPYLCYTCKGILDSEGSVGCDKCLQWFHIGCVTNGDSEEQQAILSSKEDTKWFCPTCRIPSPLSQRTTLTENEPRMFKLPKTTFPTISAMFRLKSSFHLRLKLPRRSRRQYGVY